MSEKARKLLQDCSAVLFDFDGIIIDSEWPIYQTWKKVFADEGHVLEVETYVQCIGSDFDTWSPEKHLESLTGKSYDWKTINAQRQITLENDLENAETLPGFRELITKLKADDKKIAVVSSSSHRWVDMWLKKLDIVKEMQEVVCKGDAPSIKPAPDLYLEAVKRLGLQSSQCLVMEDSLNGILSAKAAKCPAIAIPSRLTSCLNFNIADAKIESFQLLL